MTTIAVNKEEMAGDLQFTNTNTGTKWKGKTKIYKFNAHPSTFADCDFIVGFAGTASDIITVAEFFSMPDAFKNPPKIRSISGLVLTADKDIFIFDDYTKWLVVNEPFAAIGSGAPIVTGKQIGRAHV